MIFYTEYTFILLDCNSQFSQYDNSRKILYDNIAFFHDINQILLPNPENNNNNNKNNK